MEKYVGYSLKLLDIVQKFWAPLKKLFAPPGVPSWLRVCLPYSATGQCFHIILRQRLCENIFVDIFTSKVVHLTLGF